MKKIFFFGELPPNCIHGISISNEINLNFLKSKFDVLEFEDKINICKDNGIFNKIKFSIKEFFKIYKETRYKKIDYFYASLPTSTFGLSRLLIVLVIAKKFNTKAFLHLHRGDFKDKFNNNFLFKCLIKCIMSFNCEVIALSNNHKDEVLSVLNVKCHVLENTINLDEDILKEHVFNNTHINVLYLSNYIRDKGIVELLNAFDNYVNDSKSEFTLNCYGSFLDNDIELTVRSFNERKNININSSIFNEDKLRVINNCDFMILPSKNEGQPLTIIEALAFGKPIICTDVGYVSEMLPPDYKLMYDHLNEESIYNALSSLQKMTPTEYKNISDAMKENFSKIFSEKAHCKKLFLIFDGNLE